MRRPIVSASAVCARRWTPEGMEGRFGAIKHVIAGCTSASAILLIASGAHAGMINIGGGWQASWDASLDPYVDVTSFGVVGDAVFIEKSAEFIQPPPQPGFPFPPIPITFTQTDPGAVHNIVIDDEIITNSTGIYWNDFHMVLLDHDDAFFDPAATLASGGGGPIGFTISPFTFAAFAADNKSLDISDGLVPDGTQWFPGDGATDGQLWINVNTGDGVDKPLSTFTLKESPTSDFIPTPGALALLTLGGLTSLGRRRR